MRIALPLAAAFTLAACDAGTDPEQETLGEAPATSPATSDVAEGAVRLTGEGLSVGGEAFTFNAGRREVENALEQALGEPVRSATNTECEAGAIDFTDYDGGLTLHFTDGQMVGWNWHLPYEGDAPLAEDVSVTGDLALGVAPEAVQGIEGFELLEDSTLGEEFRVGEIGGFIEADEVGALFAGTQCFIRGDETAG